MSSRLVVIAPWFGPLPSYVDLWLTSASYNTRVDWLVLTDQDVVSPAPNIRVVSSTLSEVRGRLSDVVGFPVELQTPYKLCDYKPVYGAAFQEWIARYDFWAHADFDVVWGDIRQFVTEEVLDRSDRVFGGGHLSFYRNRHDVNHAFRLTTRDRPLSYVDVFTSPESFAFDEWGTARNGMNGIMPEHGMPIYFDEMPYADVKVHPWRLRNNREGFGSVAAAEHERRKRHVCYTFDRGRLLQHFLTSDGVAGSRDEAYIHLQKRPMRRRGVPVAASSFAILPPNLFAPRPGVVDASWLRREVSERGIYWHSLRIRRRNVMRKLGRLAQRAPHLGSGSRTRR